MKRSLLLLLASLSAQAAMVPSHGLDELVDQSQAIVHGRVVRSWSAWDDAHKYIWTHHLIAVIDRVRGAGSGDVIVSEPGGELGGIGMRFSGALEYSIGEEAIVFLHRTPVGYLRATGGGQGKYTVLANAKGLHTVERNSVADFKARVRAAIRRGK